MSTRRPLEVGTEQMVAYVEDAVGWMIYNNPAHHNAISDAMAAAVPRILRALQNDPEVRVIVVTGAGDKAFISGRELTPAMLTPAATSPTERGEATADLGDHIWEEIEKPVVAMIRGYCIGGGLLIALQADIRIAAEGSSFALPVARLGRAGRLDGLKHLVDLIGPAATAELVFSARRIDAAEALRLGLVNRVVAGDELEEVVAHLARTISANAPLTIELAKVALREFSRPPEGPGLARLEALAEACANSEDLREGTRAFLEKRAPVFHGR